MDECEVFKKTIDILNTDGWNQGDYYRKGSGYCLVGALYKASGFLDFAAEGRDGSKGEFSQLFSNSYFKLTEYLDKAYGTYPVAFNDRVATTKENVITVLEEACNG